LNLDQILRVNEYLKDGDSLKNALKKLGIREEPTCVFINPYVPSEKNSEELPAVCLKNS